jgi:hypothetical protein
MRFCAIILTLAVHLSFALDLVPIPSSNATGVQAREKPKYVTCQIKKTAVRYRRGPYPKSSNDCDTVGMHPKGKKFRVKCRYK